MVLRLHQEYSGAGWRVGVAPCIAYALLLALCLLLTGCVTPVPTHRTHLKANESLSAASRVVVLPMDVEVSELSAGGVSEKRDDWIESVTKNMQASFAGQTRFTLAGDFPEERRAELEKETRQIHALFRAITINQVFHGFFGPRELEAINGPLAYEVGPVEGLLQSVDAEVALLVFVRDEYSTGGRKALAVLGVLAGIPVRTGISVSSAALIDRQGKILWMNHQTVTQGDLRTPAGTDAMLMALLQGAPLGALQP